MLFRSDEAAQDVSGGRLEVEVVALTSAATTMTDLMNLPLDVLGDLSKEESRAGANSFPSLMEP